MNLNWEAVFIALVVLSWFAVNVLASIVLHDESFALDVIRYSTSLISLGVIGWLATHIYRKRMEKQLGRKVRGNHELTSISSWMEAAPKEERPRLTKFQPNMSPEERAELAKKNLEILIETERKEGRQARHDLTRKELFPEVDDDS